MSFAITYDDDKHAYTVDGESVPSVTEILNATESKDALPWWGMRVGMAAVIKLLEDVGYAGLVAANTYEEIVSGKPAPENAHYGEKDFKRRKPKTLVEKLTIERKLTTNHVKEDAGDRGTSIHAAMEAMGVGVMPDVADFPPEHRGYIQGLAKWWLDFEPEFLEQEVIVGSKKHSYAGRFDGRITYHAGVRKDEHGLMDLKTSKGVYMSHAKQLTGYEIAYTEMDAGPAFDFKQVLHVPGDGSYRLVETCAPDRVFLAAVELFHANAECVEAHRAIGVKF